MSSDDFSTGGEERADAPGAGLPLLEVRLALAMTLIAAGLSVFMPYFIAAGGISSAQDFITLSPVFFPRLAFAILAVLCLFYLLDAWRRARIARLDTRVGGAGAQGEKGRLARGAGMIAIVAAYSVLVSTLGYGLATLLMSAVVIFYLGIRQVWIVLPFAALMPIIVRFIFERLLLISLPRSDFGPIARAEDAVMRLLSGIFFGGQGGGA